MSSDFLVNAASKTQPKFAIQAKYSQDLKDPRTIEKLEIERRYWLLKKVPWFLVTDKEIDKIIVSNIEWLYGVKGYFDEIITDELLLTFEHISIFFVQHPERKVVDLCKEYDMAYQQDLGQSLFDVRLMCAARLITFDIRLPFHSLKAKEIAFRRVSLYGEHRNVAS